MRFTFAHTNFHVVDLARSLAFYEEALGLHEVGRRQIREGTLVFLGDGTSEHQLELMVSNDRNVPYALGENSFHLAFEVDNFATAHALHSMMNCIVYENLLQDIYFITDPDGYWIEIMPSKGSFYHNG